MSDKFSRRHLFRTWLAGLFGLALNKVLPSKPAAAAPAESPSPCAGAQPSGTTYCYDSQGRLTATVDPPGNRTVTLFDADGNVLGTRDAGGNPMP